MEMRGRGGGKREWEESGGRGDDKTEATFWWIYLFLSEAMWRGKKKTFMNTEWHCEVGKGLCVLPGIKTCWYYLLIHPPPLRYPQSQPSLWSLLPGPLTAHSPFDRQAATHPKTTGFYCYGWKLETLFIAFVGMNSPVGSDGPLSKSL